MLEGTSETSITSPVQLIKFAETVINKYTPTQNQPIKFHDMETIIGTAEQLITAAQTHSEDPVWKTPHDTIVQAFIDHATKPSDSRNRLALSTMWDLEKQKTLTELAKSTDPLTGLSNRIPIEKHLSRLIAESKRNPSVNAAIIIMDLTYFKDINDAYGHKAGDKILTKIAEVLKKNTRDGIDTVARPGGDEFALILDQLDITTTLNTLITKFRDINSQIKQIAPNSKLPLTFSAGILMINSDILNSADPESLVHAADVAMLYAKDKQHRYPETTDNILGVEGKENFDKAKINVPPTKSR